MERIYLNNQQYRDWTLKDISEDFGKTGEMEEERIDGDEREAEWDWVEITDLGNNEINFVAIMDEDRYDSTHGKEDVYTISEIASHAKTFNELKKEILIHSTFHAENLKLIEK